MAYMRGDHYIWQGEDGIHFWSANGYDGWDLAGWACDEDGNRHADRVDASGVSVPIEVIDEFVVMRWAQLLEEGKLIETIDRTIASNNPRGGNFGIQGIRRQAEGIKLALKARDVSVDTPEKLQVGSEGADAPYALKNPVEKARRKGLLAVPHSLLLFDFVESMRHARQQKDDQIPYFDPCDGGIHARALFLLEAPGPKAVASGFVSRNNPDPTARNMCSLMEQAEIPREATLLWNIVPWYLGAEGHIAPATKADIDAGCSYLKRLLDLLPRLEMIVLVGRKAQSAAPKIRQLTSLPFYNTHHMSNQVFHTQPDKRAIVEADFREIAALLKAKQEPQ